MKKFIVQMMLLLGFVLGYGFSDAQTPAAICAKMGTADCPLLTNCTKKGTKDCPYAISTAYNVTKSVKADCPLLGTAECTIENCPLKGTPNCPLVKNTTKVSYASNKTVAKTKEDDDLPPCCRKKIN